MRRCYIQYSYGAKSIKLYSKALYMEHNAKLILNKIDTLFAIKSKH